MMKNNLIALLDQTYPGVNALFDSPVREDGSQKWVDFATTFWHVDCVRNMSLTAFAERYRKWCKRHGYNLSLIHISLFFSAHSTFADISGIVFLPAFISVSADTSVHAENLEFHFYIT